MRPPVRLGAGEGLRSLTLLRTLLAAAALCGACIPQTGRTHRRERAILVQVPGIEARVTAADIRRASYRVIYARGAPPHDAVYNLAYVEKEGKVSVIAARTGFEDVRLTSTRIPERVKHYLLMGPILGIVGDRRAFPVGETYDSVMLRPDGRPQFRYTCDRTEEVGGVNGYHLTVQRDGDGATELEIVISPSFPFPLYVREHSGAGPITLVLVARNRSRAS